ncbi:hypothetical protein [Pseudothermotoga lettingae]|jgi:hypothetical protein|uniref:hypothetical protein n=1 Tax=Pseudothermotoga lettingae TaxID=177758 RepID=UPI000747675E|nr:hypothetical protein [Pseudothermotoga lettingae]KUK21927.1 MAG: Uncharacterized protein XD56_0173 [Pseudothermotoga lettingae]
MQGVVIERMGKFVKIKTHDGETVVKMRKKLPELGEMVRITDRPVSQKVYVAEKITEAPEALPPLNELKPLLKTIKKPRTSFDIQFLSQLVDMIKMRVGSLPQDFYANLGMYYENGEVDEKMKSLGFWLLTLSHPYVFKSIPSKKGPIHIFMNRKKRSFSVSFVKNSSIVCVKGTVQEDYIFVDFINFSPDREALEKLKDNLLGHFRNVFFKVGDLKNGLYA